MSDADEPPDPDEGIQRKAWAKAIQIIDASEPEARDLIERRLTPFTPPARYVRISRASATVDRLVRKIQSVRTDAIKRAFRMLRRAVGDKRIADVTLASWAKFFSASDATNIDIMIRSGLANRQSAAEIARKVVGSMELNGTDGITQATRYKVIHLGRVGIKAARRRKGGSVT